MREGQKERDIEKVQGRETKGERAREREGETVSILTFCVIKQSQKGWAQRDDKKQSRQTVRIHFCSPFHTCTANLNSRSHHPEEMYRYV